MFTNIFEYDDYEDWIKWIVNDEEKRIE